MDNDKAKRVLAEVARRDRDRNRIDWDAEMFPEQRAFVNDDSRLVAAICGRRAGKSTGIAVKICKVAAKYPGSIIPYITLTKSQGKKILWTELRRLNVKHGLGIKFNQNDLSATFPNGAACFIMGGDKENELERLRGPKYPAVFIDEAQAFRGYLEEVITEIIEPALMDMDGILYLTGTPNAACTGFFHDVTNTKRYGGWSCHNWTAQENPNLPNYLSWIAKRMAHYRWHDQTPTYLREWRGVWVKDENSLVYRFQNYTIEDVLPDGDWNYILGIDLGFVDSSAFVVMAYDETRGESFAVESYKEAGLIPSAVAAHVERLRSRYRFEKIVADTGGLGKGYTEEMRQRFQLPIEPAQKRDKVAFIELLNGDLSAGTLKILSKNKDLIGEARLLQWDEAHKAPDDRYEDHLCDAFLYAWRACQAYLHESLEHLPKYGSEDWYKAQETLIEEALVAKLTRRPQHWSEEGFADENEGLEWT